MRRRIPGNNYSGPRRLYSQRGKKVTVSREEFEAIMRANNFVYADPQTEAERQFNTEQTQKEDTK